MGRRGGGRGEGMGKYLTETAHPKSCDINSLPYSMIRRLVRVLWLFVPGHSRYTAEIMTTEQFVYRLVVCCLVTIR